MARPRWQRLTITTLKSAVTLVVLWAVGRHVLRTWNDLRDQSVSLHFEPGWLAWFGTAVPGGPLGLRAVLRADAAIQPDAGPARPGIAGLPGEPPGQVRSRKGDGGGGARGHGRSLRRPGVDGGDRHVLRDAGDDGLGRPDRGGRLRAGGRVASGRIHAAALGPRSSFPLYRARRLVGAGAGIGVSAPGACRRCSAGWRGWSACPSPASAPTRCRASRARLLGQGLLWSLGRLDLAGPEPARGRPRASTPPERRAASRSAWHRW